jgi:hypothetical protein
MTSPSWMPEGVIAYSGLLGAAGGGGDGGYVGDVGEGSVDPAGQPVW